MPCRAQCLPPTIDQRLGGSGAKQKTFTKLDLWGAHFRVHIKERDGWKTGLDTPWGNLSTS